MKALLLFAALASPACSYDWDGLSSGAGGGDGGGGEECGFMFASNIDPCALDAATFDWTIAQHVPFDIDADATGVPVEQLGGGSAWAIHARSLTVEAGASLTITGSRPLIVVVDGVITVEGTISVENGADLADCEEAGVAQPGGAGDDQCGGGGGGGGFQEEGGDGGGCVDGEEAETPAAGGLMAVRDTLEPLRGGCSGAAGGKFDTDEITAAAGGRGAGGLQLIARDRIIIGSGGLIDAAGQGGEGGHMGDTNEVSGGGGGGGSGGGVLLEAPLMVLDDESRVCASGGGGGGGGDAGTGADGEPGQPGQCFDGRADGGGASGDAGAGGQGGTTALLSGSGGAPSPSNLASGGGGGGAGGVIRIHTVGALVAPDPWSPTATTN
ncbi:MAG TPA: hypothetical protein VMZ28_00375 [Kofleriaceae bacterium]|nr:hypothetical protein [Kofleriaceae bacterium]